MKKLILFLITLLSFFELSAQNEIWMRPNKGQWHENISYDIGIPGGHLFLEKAGFTYGFSTQGEEYQHGHGSDDHHEGHEPKRSHVVKTTFVGAQTPTFDERLPSPFYENYFLGNNSSEWVKNSYAFNEIEYVSLYDQINLKIYQSQNTIKYDVIIAPGGDPTQFRVSYEGQDSINIIDGALRVSTSMGTIIEEKPYAYQIIAGIKQEIACNYSLLGNEMHFDFPEGYDNELPLVIDPELNFSTFTGSTSDNWGMTACPDVDGKLIGGGIVFSSGYPTTSGAFDGGFNGGAVDIGITKFNEDGGSLIYSTYIGGGASETPHSIIVNEDNDLYIMGATASTNFPVGATPYQGTNNLGGGGIIDGIDFLAGADIFLIKLAAAGNVLLGGTYLGGNNFDGISEDGAVVHNYGDQLRGEVFLDDASNVYIASTTTSTNFPIVGGFDTSLGGGKDAVVAKFNSNLSNLLWSSYIGGSGDESGNSVKVSTTGDVFVVGGTTSLDLPNTSGKIHPTYQGGTVDGYVMKFTAPTYTAEATYLGTNDYDQGYSIELDIDDFVYVYGQSSGPYQTDGDNYINSNSGQFIHKISNDLTNTEWASVFGAGSGVAEISPTAFLVSDCYEIYVAGWGGGTNFATGSTTSGFPTTGDAYQSSTSGNNFYLAVFSADMATLKYGTFMGDPSSGGDHVDGGTSRFDKSGTIYHAVCAACASSGGVFPTTSGAWSENNGASNCNMAVFQFELAQIEAVLGTGSPVICIPDPVIFENNSAYGDQFLWVFGDGNTSSDYEPTHFYEDPGVYEVMLIVSDAAGCYIPDTAYLEVTIAIFEGEAGSLSDTICPGTSVQLFAVGGDTYTWGPPGLLDDASSAEPIATISEATTFTVAIESICGSTEVEVMVFVYGTDAIAAGDTAICVGGEAELFAGGGDTYAWTPPENVTNPISGTTQASPPITTEYIVAITTIEGCLIYDTVKVKVDQDLPFPNLIDQVSICKGDSVRITAGGATDYLWTPNYNISDATLYNPFVYPEVDTSYAVTFTNACGDSFDTVDVNVIVIESFTSPDTTICPEGQAVISAGGGVFYQWYPAGYLSTDDDPTTISSPPVSTTHYVRVSDEYGCFVIDSVRVNLFTPPSIEVSSGTFPVVGDSIEIWAEADGSIEWSPPTDIACTNCPTTIVYPTVQTVYTATVIDDNGCKNNASVPIIFDPIIYVPNAFTPDGDNYNNTFKVVAHNVTEFEMLIFNRWGEIVYIMKNLEDAWDASYKGSLVKDDVYIWQIIYKDLNGVSKEQRGHVTVLK